MRRIYTPLLTLLTTVDQHLNSGKAPLEGSWGVEGCWPYYVGAQHPQHLSPTIPSMWFGALRAPHSEPMVDPR